MDNNVSIYEVKDDIINENLKEVYLLFDKLQKDGKIPCSCRECVLDVVAITLNSLPPRYYVSLMGEFFSKPEAIKDYKNDVKIAMKKAITIVKKRPHH